MLYNLPISLDNEDRRANSCPDYPIDWADSVKGTGCWRTNFVQEKEQTCFHLIRIY